MKKITLLFISLFILSPQTKAQSRQLRIIHTNDLHSYFQGYPNGEGGYAKLKNQD
jgi:2',3'-cyclic-nucleotide 2'-phosphodiesterase (5'-nucleotidase family)